MKCTIMIRAALKNMMGSGGYGALRRLYRRLNAWLYRGERLHCPVCGGRFCDLLPFGADVEVARNLRIVSLGRREASVCPGCGSKERDRAIALYLTQRCDWFRRGPRAILHIAPEEGLARFLRSLPNVSYLSGDLYPKDSPTPAMRRVDVTQMSFEADTFDLVVCNHVMEHVADDRKAMREIFRVLKTGGTAFLQVPYSSVLKKTCQDAAIRTADDRLRQYGQEDHLRLYGTDYAERLGEAGFTVVVRGPVDLFGVAVTCKSGLTLEENLFICSKGISVVDQAAGGKQCTRAT